MKVKFLFLASFTFFGFSISSAQCPTVDTPIQTFCDLESVLVGDLMAIDNGNGVVWYDTPTSTTPINNAAGLNNGEDYYADDNSGSCGSRQRVDVVIVGPPSGQNFQGVCLDDPTNATVGDLVANGNDVQWYLAPTGGTALSDSTVLNDDTLYYADQENPETGCRTSRLSVLVNVGSTPVPEGDTEQEFCITDSFNATVADLEASGLNNWYSTLFSAVPLALETPLVNGQTYYATTLDPPCESTGRLAVFVILSSSPNAGTGASLDICQNSESIDLFTVLGGSPDTGGTWSPALSSGTGVYNPELDPPGDYTYTIIATEPCEDVSATVSVNIQVAPIAGTDSTLDLCSNSDSVDLFEILGGSPQTGGTWSPALTSGSGLFDPSIDPEGVYFYTLPGTGPCDDVSAAVTVSVSTLPVAGIDASEEICDNITPFNLFDTLGGNPDPGGTWSPSLSSGSGIFNPTLDPAGTYTYTVFGSNPCPDDSATVTIIITEFPDAGTDGSIDLCSNNPSVNLFNSLGGTPEAGGTWSPALSSGTGIFNPAIDPPGVYTYTLVGTPPCPNATASVTVNVETAPNAGTDGSLDVCSDAGVINLFNSLGGNPDPGGAWSPTLNSGTGVFDPSIDPEGTYTYTIFGTSICSGDTANVTVVIVPFLDAGLDGSVNLCSNDTAVNLFDSLGGMPQSGGVWTPTLNSGTGIFDPNVDAPGIYTYTLSGTASCSDSSAEVTVSIEVVPEAGLNGSLNICSNSDPINLFDSLGGTPELGGTWSPNLNSGTGVFDPNIDSAGTYTYTQLSNTPSCENDTATVTVTVSELANAGNNGAIDLCSNSGIVDLFDSLGGSPETGGSWSPVLSSGTGLFDPAIDPEGIYTYTIASTTPCPDVSATVAVGIETVPEAGLDGSIDLCSIDAPVNLFDSLGGTPDVGGTWSPALSSGTGIFDPSLDSAGNYTYTISGSTGVCPDNTAIVNVTVSQIPNPGIDADLNVCSNDGPIDLFDVLGGTPQPGGAWSPPLISGPGIFNPSIDAAGVYTYSVIGAGSCPDASAAVNVSIEPEPNAGEDGTAEICDDNPVNLFNFIGGTPDATGFWSPPLLSGNGIFDPAIDIEGTYTYSVFSSECDLLDEASVIVTLGESPDLSNVVISSDSNFCIGSSIVVTISGANTLADGTYDITYQLFGANNSVNSTTVNLVSGISFFNISGNILENPGLTTITITEFFFSGSTCSGDTQAIQPIQVTIENIETPELVEEGASFCLEDEATITSLTNNVIGAGTIVWYDAAEGGSIYDPSDLLVDGQIYYGAFVSENECESSPRLEATVIIDTCILELIIPDGFSPNDDGINDDFHIVNLNELFPEFQLTIFNRYGNELYKGDVNSPRWNGTSKKGNGIAPVGVYFYILEFNDGVRSPQQGRVYLSR